MRRIKLSQKAGQTISSWLLLAPAFIFLILFTVYPILKNIYLSVFNTGMQYATSQFVGLDNYKSIFSDPVFWKVVRNTIFYTIITVVPCMVIGFLLAILLNSKFKGLRFLRTAFFYPVVMPMIAVACIWKFLYMPGNGMFEQIVQALFHISLGDVLSGSATVLPALAIMYIWKESGYLMIFFLAGLQNLSEEYFEAAKMDGAGFWKILQKITIPLMRPTTLFVTMIEITNSIKVVDHISLLTQGKPNNGSSTLMYYIYELGYQFFSQNKAAAVTTVLLVVLLVVSLPRFFSSDESIDYN